MVQYVIGTSTCNAQQTKFVSVEAFVPAALTSSRLPDLCNTNAPFNLTPISLSAGSWAGPGINGFNFNPSVAGAGKFVLTHHTASSPGGLCPDQATIAVQVFSLAPPSIFQAGPFCSSAAPVQLIVSPLGGLFSGANSSAVSWSGKFDPSAAVPGDNIISYSIASGPCIAYAQTTVGVEKFVSAAFVAQPKTQYCQNEKPFNLYSLVMNPGGSWQSPGQGLTGNMFDPAKADKNAPTQVIYHTRSQPRGLCTDTHSISISVQPMPDVTIMSNSTGGCVPAEVFLNTPNTNGQGEWNLGDGSPQVKGDKVSHVYTTPGTYSVVFNFSSGACSTQTTLFSPITVLESPKADFSFSKPEVSISEPEVTLINQSTVLGDNKYEWAIQGQPLKLREVSPTVEFSKIGHYMVTLTATNLFNCTSKQSRMIEVKNDFKVFIPNSFTPNMDGINDRFIPVFSSYGLDVKSFEMEIFDRWGHLLYHTRDVTKGWDGTVNNKGDETLKQDNYVYRIRYKDLDGKVYESTGHVTRLP
jgi:gliding motility-associated-like protein